MQSSIQAKKSRAALYLLCLSIICIGFLSACGFSLKGHHDYAFKRLHIAQASSADLALSARLTRLIQSTGKTLVVNDLDQADVFFNIELVRTQKVLSINLEGLVEEYELDLTVNYSLSDASGRMFILPSVLSLNRSMTYSDQYALAKATQSELLYTDMENDAADQLARRLAAVKNIDPASPVLPSIRPRTPLPPSPL